jgi:hypothetical protein
MKMHRSVGNAAMVTLLGLASGASTVMFGCFFHAIDDCDRLGTCELPVGAASGSGGDGGTNPACVPSENNTPVDDNCGVFVSSSEGNDENAGTKSAPLKTLQAALDMAKGQPVYACAEEHVGSVTLASGIAIYGGLDCSKGWRYVGATKKSVLTGSEDEVALTIMKSAGGAEVVDFRVQAADATKEGGSSIAVLADGATAELLRCELVAGNGAKGADGASGDPNGTSAAGGAAGNAGQDACSDLDGTPGPDPKLVGGDAVTNDCSGEVSVGGQGGDGNVLFGGGGDLGQTGSAGQAGTGEPSMGMWSCTVGVGIGNPGSPGEVGMPGPGAKGAGTISTAGYTGTSGGAGTSGKAGQGGGGGGGAKGGMICPPGNISGSGASGGSGGAGGCGGLPGQGGRPGGASIALVSLNASITLTDCSLSSSKGGDGGAGGDAQGGGPGGDAGKGGMGVGLSKAACDGGKGGAGGNGGPGGGGLGGPSLGIAFQGDPPKKEGKTTVMPDAPGAGGLGGSADVAMNSGEAGAAGEEQALP